MTSNGDSSQIVALRAGGVGIESLPNPLKQQGTGRTTPGISRKFWASTRRWISSTHRDVLEISFGSKQLVNHVSLRVSRFPLIMQVEYLDANGDWQGLQYASTRKKKGPNRQVVNNPIVLTLSESVPKKVDSARATSHPQHFGAAHWSDHSWKTKPVRTSKVRFVFTRNHRGTAPVNPHGKHVPYSVAIKDLRIGYKVTGLGDLPVPRGRNTDWWASSTDILGSRTVYSTYTQPVDSVIDGDLKTYWRSEPQPFPFAVVNLYLDVRDHNGQTPVIDRFWMDPVSVGPVCNLYYSTDEPSGDFEGPSDDIPSQWRTEVGSPTVPIDGATGERLSVDLGPSVKTGVEVSNTYERMRYDEPWWVGVDASALVDASGTDWHPIITLGGVQVAQDGATLKAVAPTGETASVDLDPALHVLNSGYRLVVAYYPYDEASRRASYLHLSYTLNGYDSQVAEVAVKDLTDQPTAPIRVGMHPDPNDTTIAAISVKGLVVKAESLGSDIEEWFIEEGAGFVADPDVQSEDRGTAQNALLRLHPSFVSEANIFGVVGGEGDRFANVVWTPVMRNYSLKRGYLRLPPTKAAYWKFEMTRLSPQIYENAITISRDALVFPPSVVAAYEATTGRTNNATPAGISTIANTLDTINYADAIATARATAAPDAANVLVVSDPRLAQRVAQNGWIWTYQPWHMGSDAPKFLGTQVHHYEAITVEHTTKVAFFAGLRELTPYRTDYTFADDTPEYVEHLLDDTFIGSLDGVLRYDGGLRAQSSSGTAISQPLRSYRTVRGIQFATQETDAYQVLDDPSFEADNLDRWGTYGDADIERLGPGDVAINRGYIGYDYAHWEAFTYADMEAFTYGQLEGNSPTGYAEGGMTSQTYSPSGAGQVLAIAEVSAEGSLNAPVRLEIVSADTGKVVAFSEKYLQQGETAVMETTYASGNLLSRRTYGDVEHLDYVVSVEQGTPGTDTPETYAELEAYTYGQIESGSVQSDLYVRIRQQGATRDDFHVHRVGLYDSPVAWFFSNDNGQSWWEAIGVRNDPHGVLLFPEPADPANVTPDTGRTLLWKAEFFREGATVNALHIRPWYGDRFRTVEGAHTMEALGPTISIYDDNPATVDHPMWQPTQNLIEHEFSEPVITPFWRNLAINPGGEGASTDGFATSGGIVETQIDGWTVMVPQSQVPTSGGGA